MSEKRKRPFYTDYAWAFDLIIDRPIRKECAAIVNWLIERDTPPGAQLLDAGCGTGRYSVELARRGYVVHGVDASADLIDVANRSLNEADASLSFAVGDILKQLPDRCDAILSRGVLNDFIDDVDRALVLKAFSQVLRPRGSLILDVREWESSAERKAREPVFRKSVDTERGRLSFTSITELDRENRQLLSSERHTLVVDGQERPTDYYFVMRCWTRAELESGLECAGFENAVFFGAYDASVPAGATDRIVAVAQTAAEHRDGADGAKLTVARRGSSRTLGRIETMEAIKNRAQALRMGLIGGYVSIAEVVAWADALIGEDHGHVVPQLFDLALLRPADLGRAVSLLGEVPGEVDRRAVGREIVRLLHRGLVSARLTEREVATALFTALHEGCSPDAEFENMAYYFDDGVDLALQGVYGNLADLRAEMLEYLSRASQPNGSA